MDNLAALPSDSQPDIPATVEGLQESHTYVVPADDSEMPLGPIAAPAYTPGPWAWHQNTRGQIGITGIDTSGEDSEGKTFIAWVEKARGQKEQNARLIAEAPKLLAATEWLIEYAYESAFDTCVCCHCYRGDDHNEPCAVSRWEQAVSRAKGVQ